MIGRIGVMLLFFTRLPLAGLGMTVVNGTEAVTRNYAASVPPAESILVRFSICDDYISQGSIVFLFTAVTSTAAAAIAKQQPDYCLSIPVIH
jgi:hypothetical protein